MYKIFREVYELEAYIEEFRRRLNHHRICNYAQEQN